MPLAVVRPLWNYRGFILGSVKREFQSKYQNSLLGALWNVLQPLAMIIVYTVIFSQVMQARLPGLDNTLAYSIYLCAGILTWGLFAEITSRAQTLFLDNANLLKKISFPRMCLPTIVVTSALVNFSIILTLFTLFLIVTGNFPGAAYLSLFPLLLLQVAFAIGLGITLGVLNVFFRDVGHFFGVFLQFWFWLTPIVYPISILPEAGQHWIQYNPMTSLMAAYQGILVMGQTPNWLSLWPIALLTLLLNLLGYRLFRKRAGEIVDEL